MPRPTFNFQREVNDLLTKYIEATKMDSGTANGVQEGEEEDEDDDDDESQEPVEKRSKNEV
jgi:hypothetical protein